MGAQILWVLEAVPSAVPGTAQSCDEVMTELGAGPVGLCVGDGETQPVAGTFDDSPFSVDRGFDMVVPRATMEIRWSSSHGSPSGNENPEGDDVLQVLEALAAELP